jgi:hypothetical protein
MLRRFYPPLAITGLGLLFFSALLLHPAYTLYAAHSDLLGYYIPVKRFLVRSWQRTGEVPLWGPFSFGGMPFVHDILASVFYPLHLPLYALPEQYMGSAESWLVVLHVIAAGLCMYAYARSQGLGQSGALVAGIGYMFAGKWLFHLLMGGHMCITPLAWLPLVLLLLEGAFRWGSILRAVWAGAAFALIILGTHPQWTFYAGLFVAVWTLGPALERAGFFGDDRPRSWQRTATALGQWALYGATAATIAVALSAVQLLPTWELAEHTSRAILPRLSLKELTFGSFVREYASRIFLRFVGPGDVDFGWENRSGLGLSWLLAATLAVVGGRGRVRFQAIVGVLPILYALGGWVLVQKLPGFQLFRLPQRTLMLTALPLALLAGTATDWLFAARERPAWLSRSAWALGGVLALGVLLIAAQVAVEIPRLPSSWIVAWGAAGIAVAVVLVLLSRFTGAATPAWKLVWGGVLLAESWALTWPLLDLRPDADLFAPSACVQFVAAQGQPRGRVLDRDVPSKGDCAPLGPVLPLLLNIESVRGYSSLDVHRYKQYLRFIGGDAGEARPAEMVRIDSIKNKPLLDLLGVRYLIQPAAQPVETDGWQPVTLDAHPRAYCVFYGDVRSLPPYLVYENQETFPRTFIVPAATPMPGQAQALAALETTDFRQKVLLEGLDSAEEAGSSGAAFRPATIREYQPNRVTVTVVSEAAGYLVLTDNWFPGWVATVNGQPAILYRANYLFRAVPVPAGHAEVVFTFDPASYRCGRLISTLTMAVVASLSGIAAALALRRKVLTRLLSCADRSGNSATPAHSLAVNGHLVPK